MGHKGDQREFRDVTKDPRHEVTRHLANVDFEAGILIGKLDKALALDGGLSSADRESVQEARVMMARARSTLAFVRENRRGGG